MKPKRALFMLSGILMLFWHGAATASATAQVLDRIVAVVNEEIILLSELRARMDPFDQRIRQQGFEPDRERQMLARVRQEVLNQLVDEKLTDQEIRRTNIRVGETDIDSAIESIKIANNFTEADLRQFLQQEQMTMDEYRETIKEQVLRTRLVNYQVKSKIVITEAEIQTYYDRHPERYGGKRIYHLRNILMRPSLFAVAAAAQPARETMEQLRNRVEAGEAFADLSRTYSQSPAAADGGDIGWFEEATLSPQIRAALEGLQPGQTTAVLETDQGLQLFFVEAIDQTEGKPLDQVRNEIHQTLYEAAVEKRFASWLENLRSQSHIKIVN